jgi:hypothetical protein
VKNTKQDYRDIAVVMNVYLLMIMDCPCELEVVWEMRYFLHCVQNRKNMKNRMIERR